VILDWHFYALAIPAVLMLGLSKGGFAGIGALSLPMLAFAISPVQAAAILLPILIVQDVVGVWAFRRTVDWRLLGWMMPGAILGIVLGYLFAAKLSESAVLGAVGAISLLFGAYRLWADRNGPPQVAKELPEWLGVLFGIASGFTQPDRACRPAAVPGLGVAAPPAMRRAGRDDRDLLCRGQLDQGAGLYRARPVHPRQSADRRRIAAGGDRLDLRRRLAGTARLGRALLRRDLPADGAGRGEVAVGRLRLTAYRSGSAGPLPNVKRG